MEVNVILEYKRKSDSWICPECDTENDLSIGKCTICGCAPHSATIMEHWTEPEEKTPANEYDEDVSDDSNTLKIVLGIIIVSIVVLLLIAAS